MTEPGIDQESLPPAVLLAAPRSASRMRVRVPGAPVTTARGQEPSPVLTAGPGGYGTPVKAAQRPRNLQELQQRVQLEDTAAWPAGASVPIGIRGKVAHWTGEVWRSGKSPGYAPTSPPPAGDPAGAAVGDDAAPAAPAETADATTTEAPAETPAPVDPPTQELPVQPAPPPWGLAPAVTPAETPDVQFPGDGTGTPEDLHR